MIELNKKTQQDFLNREWVQKLLNAGVNMSDAKYIIAKDKLSMNDDDPDLTDYVWYKDSTAEVYDVCPTYTISELLNKLHKCLVDKAGNDEFGEISICQFGSFASRFDSYNRCFPIADAMNIDSYIESLVSLLRKFYK